MQEIQTNYNPKMDISKFVLKQFSRELVESSMQLLIETYAIYHPLYTYLRPTEKELIEHYLPLLSDTTCFKYSYAIIDQNTQKVVAIALQKDIHDIESKYNRTLSNCPQMAYKQKLCWSQVDRILEDYTKKCEEFKIDPQNEEILGNIHPGIFMYQVVSAVHPDYQQHRLGSLLQYSLMKKATVEGFVYGCSLTVNDKFLSIVKKCGGPIKHQIDLYDEIFQSKQIFRRGKQRYLYTLCGSYKNPKHNHTLVDSMQKKMKTIQPSL